MHQLSAHELHRLFIENELSATEIIQNYLDRIALYDAQVGSFLKVYEDTAREQAEILDKKRNNKQRLGKLAGIPIAIKDNILMKGETTTCGSKFLTNYKAPYNATVIDLLLQEDAIILGKTNLDEFAMGSSTENSALQQTRNPWNLNCTPGGSSGGSAAAVAARFAPIALGSDTGGSIRQPASFCGIVGFKPTYGRVSRYGLVAFGSSLDQIGPMTTNSLDAALIMEVIGRHCQKDSTSIQEESKSYISDFKDSIKGLKFGVPWNFLQKLEEEPKKSFQKAIEKIKELGGEIVEVNLDILEASVAVYYILATAEASTNLARFDGIRYGQRSLKAKTLDEVYEFSKEEGFGPEVKRRILLGTYVLSSGYQNAYYRKAQKIRTLIIRSYQEAFAKCDLIVSPVTPFAAFEIGSIKDPLQMYLEDIYSIPINLAGVPAVSIPNELSQQGKPIGFQIIGPQMKDALVLNVAHLLEKSFPFNYAHPKLTKEKSV